VAEPRHRGAEVGDDASAGKVRRIAHAQHLGGDRWILRQEVCDLDVAGIRIAQQLRQFDVDPRRRRQRADPADAALELAVVQQFAQFDHAVNGLDQFVRVQRHVQQPVRGVERLGGTELMLGFHQQDAYRRGVLPADLQEHGCALHRSRRYARDEHVDRDGLRECERGCGVREVSDFALEPGVGERLVQRLHPTIVLAHDHDQHIHPLPASAKTYQRRALRLAA
jgi:hypothetical protein